MTSRLAIGLALWCLLAPLAYSSGQPARALWPQPQQTAPSRPHPAVVRVVAPGNGSVSYGSGTLVAVNERHGIVITNWHVINEATGQIGVVFPDGFQSAATVVKTDRDWDLAALAIWKPNVAPVPLATAAPQAGERLTIAGYGAGSYREAQGPCTQYVAPGKRFPYEMVELAAAARQGDSGGPILNDRGELAGVLFGEGQGRTAGSYCGRVQWFLTSITPVQQRLDTPAMLAANRNPSAAGSQVQQGGQTGSQPPSARGPADRAAAQGLAPPPAPSELARSEPPRPQRPMRPVGPAQTPQLPAAPSASLSPRGPTQRVGWRDIAGDTAAEQVKTVLAGLGALAVILHSLAWLSGERK